MLCIFSKCSLHTLLTCISSVTKEPSLFIILSSFPVLSFLTFCASFQKSFLFPCKSPFILLPNCSFTSFFLLCKELLVSFFPLYIIPSVFLLRPHHLLLTHSTMPLFYF